MTPGSPSASAPAAGAENAGDPALLGRTIAGTFTIEQFLGGGAMGAVYRARQSALERNVAVKVMHRAVAVDPSFVARFHREAKAASRLDHPNSMRVLAFGEEPDGLLYIAMEYLDGRDLYRVIHEDWPLSNERIGDIVMQALAAIAVAHDMGVIHRDLKPENIMILRSRNDEGREADLVKVCDFGIAKLTDKDDDPKPEGPAGQKLTTQGIVVGTPEYMSPEQARGEKLDARSDVYSMGIILYQLLTGRTPFTADTPLAIVLKHISDAPQPPVEIYPGVHRGLESIALKALAKDRNVRFQSAREMRNAIRTVLEGRPMPVDASAPTDVAAPTLAGMPATAGSGGGALAPSTGPGVPRAISSASGGAVAATSAPTIAGAPSTSKITPLGTAAAAPEEAPRRSRKGLVAGVLAVAALAAAGAVAAPRLLASGREPTALDTTTTATTTTATASASASAATPMAPTASAPSSRAIVAEPKATATQSGDTKAKTNVTSPPLRASASPKNGEPAPAAAGHPPEHSADPAPAPEPAHEAVHEAPAPPAAPPPPPPQAAPAAPAPPPFNPGACRAATGTVRSSGATNAKDLSLGSAAQAWTSCAQRSIKERPPGPLAASVHLRFSDSGVFQSASCAACPPAMQQCIAQNTKSAVRLTFKGGDVTGEPAFDVPLTVSCD